MNVRRAVASDAAALHVLAAATFPLACPPHTTAEAIAAFIGEQLSLGAFERYLADPGRIVLVAEGLDTSTASALDPREAPELRGLLGYTMLVGGEPVDTDVRAAVTARPTIELSKCYVLPGAQGSGTAAALMAATIDAASARTVWLGVNNENARAQRFYEKSGFARVGTKRFRVGDRLEDDYVYERAL